MTPTWSSAAVVLAMVSGLFQVQPAQGVSEPGVARSPTPFERPLPPAEERQKGAASRYANLAPVECRRQLKAQPGHEAFVSQGSSNGIASAMRVVGPLSSIVFKVPPQKSPFGVLDCRQAMLWLSLVPVLVEHGVVSIEIDNFYRNRAKIGSGHKSQHAYGLAADVTAISFDAGSKGVVRSKTGVDLPSGSGRAVVEQDFLGKLGEPVCGPGARIVVGPQSDPEQVARATRLRNLVCDLAARGAFHHILTPNYNLAHKNHLHLDLKRSNSWFSVQ